MKKLLLSVVAVLATVIMCVSFAACSSTNFVGTYKFKSMQGSSMGMEINIEVGKEYMGVTITEDYMTLEVKEDGTLTMSAAGGLSTQTGTWEEKDGKIVMTYGGVTSEGTLSGGVLTITGGDGDTSNTVKLKKK